MPGIGMGVKELRVQAIGQFRIIYIAAFEEGIRFARFPKKDKEKRYRFSEVAFTRCNETEDKEMTMMRVTPAEHNVFEALELPDAQNLRLRAELMATITQIWRDSGLRQCEMAKRMHTTPARLNEVIKGRIDKCTVDRLVKMLAALGKQISLTINDARNL